MQGARPRAHLSEPAGARGEMIAAALFPALCLQERWAHARLDDLCPWPPLPALQRRIGKEARIFEDSSRDSRDLGTSEDRNELQPCRRPHPARFPGEPAAVVRPVRSHSALELRQLNEALVAEISPADKLSFLRLMIPAATREGRLALLEPVRAALPPGPFQGVLAALRSTLSEADFEDLNLSLSSSAARSPSLGAAH